MDKILDQLARDVAAAVQDACAKIVESIPVSASLYESATTAMAVAEFQKLAASEIRSLKPITDRSAP